MDKRVFVLKAHNATMRPLTMDQFILPIAFYPIDPSFIVDGSFLPQEYVADASDPTCQLVPSSYYIPSVLPYVQDGVLGSTTTPLQHPNFAYVPSMFDSSFYVGYNIR